MKVLIADGEAIVRRKLYTILQDVPGVEVVGTADKGQEVLALIERECPNVAILDINVPEKTGIEVLRRVKGKKPAPITIILTNHVDQEHREACLTAGAELFIDKVHGLDQLRPILRGLSEQFQALRAVVLTHKESEAILRQTMERLRETMERFHLAVSGSSDGLWDVTFLPGTPWHNPAQPVWYSTHLKEMLGYAEHEWPHVLASWDTLLHADDRARVFAAITAYLERRTVRYDIEYRLRTKQGEVRWFRARGIAIWDESGRASRMAGSLSDITDRKLLESQLLQAQKIESLGRLAGGIAHDFNNVLTAILGYSQLIESQLSTEDQLYGHVKQIRKAGEHALALTQQLLAFSRRQEHRPQVLDLNSVISKANDLLQRLLGTGVQLSPRLTPSLSAIFADPCQVQQVLLNLVINARDAIGRTGTVTIETGEVELDELYARSHVAVSPGRYVMLAVTDTGCGMDEQTKSRIFEPFFTTKGDRGTGLGLATVYGSVKQSGGSIWVYSEPGQGTTFRIYFPCASQDGDKNGTGSVPLAPLTAERGTETILVVENDANVRLVAVEILKSLGYLVLEARSQIEALALVRISEDPIQLLVSDVVMPMMNGREFAREMLRLRPGLRVIFMSGYSEDYVTAQGFMDPGSEFVQKPFTVHSLANKVRAILG
ncbi:MAG: response regulator [Nitrospira sp. BO4]|jgi:PAS domain S-box-containing protein|nr:response regulator [Nitrospira sp. BO4]